MKTKILLLGIACLCFGSKHLYANIDFADHYLTIDSESPPAAMVVSDSLGNLAGVDLTKNLDQYGRGSSVSNISGSDVEQQNIIGDEGINFDLPQKNTSWTVYIQDQPAQIYTVNLMGTNEGIASLYIGGGYSGSARSSIPTIVKLIAIAQGETRTVQVYYDSSSASLTITPVVNSGSLLQDTQIACTLGAISPAEACEVLEAIASEVEKSITQGNTSAEAIELNLYLLVLNQLHNWGNAGSIQNWGNCNGYSECLPLCNKGLNGTNFFAKDPAYSALELDAQTLLNALPNQGTSQGGGNQGPSGNQGGGNQGGQGNQGGGQGSNGNQGNQGGSNQGGQGNQGGENQGNH